eukprot:CAMPEP_0179164256 /NCGR_PEP_ID=MMETSP0796-20121207/80596_1 /TAXON_ID=73915 /ORGANISM="Pyrodinium bahamense, Strain pbaha01" /LENGTH=54 /DNA_ID=CAMNT_0020866681 /DNA_START=116 /DNA_END=278 /DNA_ORIENTATION=-
MPLASHIWDTSVGNTCNSKARGALQCLQQGGQIPLTISAGGGAIQSGDPPQAYG